MIIKINPNFPEEKIILKSVEILIRGGLIVYPTETAYGLGCDAYNEEAIKKLFVLKKRSISQPCSVIVSSQEMIEEIAYVNDQANILINKFLPGPLVIALPKKKVIPDILNSNGIAFRISSNKIAHLITNLLKRPLVSTSANITGDTPPYSIDDVIQSLDQNKIDLILDSGNIPKNIPSTIVDFLLEMSPQITREGEITKEEILKTLNIPKYLWENHFTKK
ncbi:MAG TPA: L-threonylcarbamoyladenylate synthase [candidate division Zixibacteria bacterium]|nr:L-threonylcarbamoyladenylate synthase [candidate division Zixibacteria bacterium]